MTRLVNLCVLAGLGIGLGMHVCPGEVAQATEKLSLQELLNRIEHADGPTERLRAAEEIARFGDLAVPGLCGLLRHEDQRVQSHACLALIRMGPAAERAIPQLSRMACDPRAWTREDAIFALGQVGPAANPAVPILGGVLQVEDRRLRKRAIQALAAIRTPDALRTLAAPLHGDDSEFKMQLLRVFQELGPSAAVVRPNLLDAALTESDRLVCDELYLTLGTLGDAILDNLLALFEHSSKTSSDAYSEASAAVTAKRSSIASHADIRRRVVMSLCRMGHATGMAVPTLHRALEDPDATVRFWAARALCESGASDSTTRTALMRALTDADADVRWGAARALRNIEFRDNSANSCNDNRSALVARKEL